VSFAPAETAAAPQPQIDQPTIDPPTIEYPLIDRPAPVAPELTAAGAPGNRLRVLDGLRWLAALSVLAYHYVAYGRGTLAWGVRPSEVFPTASLAASYGWLGVQVFFLISGFVICMSAWGRSLSGFFVSRAARLYPAYWVSVVMITVVLTLWPIFGKPLELREVLVNLTMMQSGLGAPNVDGIYWTLWIEFLFYLLFSVVVWKGLTYRRVVAFVMIWSVAAILAPTLRIPVLNYLVIVEWAPYFISGITCFLIYRFGHSPLLWGIIAVNWTVAVYRMYPVQAAHARLLGDAAPAATWPALVVITAAFVFLLAIASGWFARVEWKWLTTLGALTYPTYLLHEYTGWTAINALAGHLPAPLILVIVTAAVIALAWAVHVLVERPMGRWMRRRLTAAFDRLRPAGQGLAD
jgi:peptidoglycan/LPS O-acetylase OafA/YrhL